MYTAFIDNINMHEYKVFARFSIVIELICSDIDVTYENLLMFPRTRFIRLKISKRLKF